MENLTAVLIAGMICLTIGYVTYVTQTRADGQILGIFIGGIISFVTVVISKAYHKKKYSKGD